MTDVMKVVEVHRLAASLMVEHGLGELGWRFDLDNGKQRIGCCHHHEKLITFSIHYISRTDMEDIKDVILHEIAHALVGTGHGHNWTWKMKCIEIGARPERLAYAPISTSSHNYVIVCDACGRKWKRHRLKAGYLNGHFHSGCCQATMTVYEYQKG